MVGMLALIASCGDDEVVKVSDQDDGATVNVDEGNIIELSLESNPTTGFSWAVTTIDESVLMQTGDPTFESESDGLGSGGIETFQFETVRPGSTTLELAYRRSFEQDVEPAKTFKITLNVQ